MRRLLALLALAASLVGASAASAHPLGNFSLNRLAVVRVSDSGVDVRWILDQAEIPTFQERGRSPADVLALKTAAARRGLGLTVDGRPVPLALTAPGRITFPRGQGGLRTTRVELVLHAPASAPRRVELRDTSFASRVGWHDIVVRPGAGTAVRSSVPATDPTGGLRAYPKDLISSPPRRSSASFAVRPGAGTVSAPDGIHAGATSTDRGAGGFAGLFDDAAAGRGVLIAFLLAAFGWGALHALSPGHGKTMVAAYLVGTRGRPRDAIALGATVTVTHTIGVFALGAITLALSDFILPEDLYPWLNLVAGALVLLVGLGVLRSRVRHARAPAHGHQHEQHEHHHDHAHPHTHERGLFALGASAGLIPCPSALVVLLGAVAQAQIALGMVLILAFSLGLATTLTVLGLAAVWATRRTRALELRGGAAATAVRVLPTASALVIVALGSVLTAHAVPQVLG
jgi:nickel/cobalt exporter